MLDEKITVTDLALQQKLKFFRGAYNIIDCGTRTGKTYWAVNNLREHTRDGRLDRILYLVDTNTLKEQILQLYSDTCTDADIFWEDSAAWGQEDGKIGVMCYQRLGMQVMSGQIDFLTNIDVICWDECDSIFDFAAAAFAKARKTDYNRQIDLQNQEISNAEILAVIQRYSSKKEYMPLVLLGQWEIIINEGRILCIGLSATPERARAYYSSLVSAANHGKLEAGYRLSADIYFTNVLDHIGELSPEAGRGYWCYSPYIEPNRGIVAAAERRGFHAIEIHSPNNTDKPMNTEQMRVYEMISKTGMVPAEYDFVVVNKALARGINIIDQRFDNVIVNSFDAADRIQAARQTFNYQRHLKTFCSGIPEQYLNKWLTIQECRELAAFMAVPSLDKEHKNTSKVMTWNSLKEYLPAIGYTVEQKRKMIDGKQQQACYISGEWHDAEIQDGDFLALARAKSQVLDH